MDQTRSVRALWLDPRSARRASMLLWPGRLVVVLIAAGAFSAGASCAKPPPVPAQSPCPMMSDEVLEQTFEVTGPLEVWIDEMLRYCAAIETP
jgi:hypothetical protein